MVLLCAADSASANELIDYFRPIPITSPLKSDVWGDPGVRPRDTSNGLESVDNQNHYWDGKILKTPDGKYHLHASRWPKRSGFNQWSTSIAVHAVSDQLLGPYVDKGPIYDRNGGKGHNVSSLALPGGDFAVYTSDITPGDFYIAGSIDGPWTFKGSIKLDKNGNEVTWPTSNISVILRPDNTFLATQRSGHILLGGTELLGPYVVQGPSVYPKVAGLNNDRAEDPVLWYSGGYYHLTVNWWDSRVAHHLMSKDGIHNWKDMGVAYDPRRDFIRYSDGTINHWHNLERPGVVIENGHVVAFTFAATDVDKSSEKAGDNHGSKIIVVPFDGVAFDAEFGDEPSSPGAAGAGGSGAASGSGGAAGEVGGAGASGRGVLPNGGSGFGGAGLAGGSNATPTGGPPSGAGGTSGSAATPSSGSSVPAMTSAGSSGNGRLGASAGTIATEAAAVSASGSAAVQQNAGNGSMHVSSTCSCRAAGADDERSGPWGLLSAMLGALAVSVRRRGCASWRRRLNF